MLENGNRKRGKTTMTGLSFILGILTGVTIALFITGATRTNKENELYMEGYNAGKADKLEYEIDILKARHGKYAYELMKDFTSEEGLKIAFCTGKGEAYRECVELLETGKEK